MNEQGHSLMKAPIYVCIFAFILMMVSSCANARREPTNAELEQDFYRTALGRIQLPEATFGNKLYPKIEKNIVYKILGDYDANSIRYVREVAEIYSRAAWHPIRVITQEETIPGEDEVAFIIFSDHRPLSRLAEFIAEQIQADIPVNAGIIKAHFERRLEFRFHPMPGMAHLASGGNICNVESLEHKKKLHRFSLISNSYPKFYRCIGEEMLQALGLPKDTVKSWGSIMRVDSAGYSPWNLEKASPYDLLYLRILYDRRLTPETTIRQARPIVQEIITAIRPDETQSLGFEWIDKPTPTRARKVTANQVGDAR